ncbi:MAG: hypothetical protein CM15mP65_27240 [Crocinitomicaceae bacterium]|nr:MAG: hypothetical protein CM15mP65_27240 [Crocinitomicaceae bacterium]
MVMEKRATSFNDMTNLSLSLRELINKHFIINAIKLSKAQKAMIVPLRMLFY